MHRVILAWYSWPGVPGLVFMAVYARDAGLPLAVSEHGFGSVRNDSGSAKHASLV